MQCFLLQEQIHTCTCVHTYTLRYSKIVLSFFHHVRGSSSRPLIHPLSPPPPPHPPTISLPPHLQHVINSSRREGWVGFHVQDTSKPRPPMLQSMGVGLWLCRCLQNGRIEPYHTRHPLQVVVFRLHLTITGHPKPQEPVQTQARCMCVCNVFMVHRVHCNYYICVSLLTLHHVIMHFLGLSYIVYT